MATIARVGIPPLIIDPAVNAGIGPHNQDSLYWICITDGIVDYDDVVIDNIICFVIGPGTATDVVEKFVTGQDRDWWHVHELIVDCYPEIKDLI